jgi:hypothetical protein
MTDADGQPERVECELDILEVVLSFHSDIRYVEPEWHDDGPGLFIKITLTRMDPPQRMIDRVDAQVCEIFSALVGIWPNPAPSTHYPTTRPETRRTPDRLPATAVA